MTTIFTASPINDAPAAGYSLRNELSVSGGAQTQVRVTFVAGSGGDFQVDHCSIGVSKQDGTGSSVSTPVELLFSGVSGFTLMPNGSIVSDWVNFAGFTSVDKLIVVIDATTLGVGGHFASVNGYQTYFRAASASYNQATVTGYTPLAADYSVSLIETQASGTPRTPTLTLMGVG